MKRTKLNYRRTFIYFILLSTFSIFAVSCTNDDDPVTKANRNVQYEATDAAIDNVNVEAVFVTVSELKVNGEALEGFQKTTLELSALTEGRTEILGNSALEGSTVNTIELVLDYETDANGEAPGCYVLKPGAVKDKLSSTAGNIVLQVDQTIESNSDASIILDFDLRKLIREENEDFEFVTMAEFESNMRATMRAHASHVKGMVDTGMSQAEKHVIYIYKKGEYNASTELEGQGESKIQFANAVNSATLGADGEFVLSFIEEGDYELHLFEYNDTDQDGRLEVTGEAEIISLTSLDLGNIHVGSEANVQADLKITGVLPL